MIAIVLLAIVHQSCARVPMMRNIMEPQIMEIDDVEGFLYDVPEFEDPLLIQQELSSIGAMPIFRLLESTRKRGNLNGEKANVAELKKAIDDVMDRLELVREKLAGGYVNIYTDIEKIIENLKTLGKSARPDIRQMMNSLQSLMPIAMPVKMSGTKDVTTTNEPESNERTGVLEPPQGFDKQALRIRIFLGDKPELDKTPNSTTTQSLSDEKSSEEKITEEISNTPESSEISQERYETTNPPFEYKTKERKNENLYGEDVKPSSKLTWKQLGIP